MIGMLRGTVWTKDSSNIILEVNGVGYLLYLTAGCIAGLTEGEERVFYTYLLVREDELALYGFVLPEEKEIFLQLLSVSGIGPKAALAILEMFPVKRIRTAILQEDVASLTQVPGIGAKTAKRIILELKEKIKDSDPDLSFEQENAAGTISSGQAGDALETLLALGFARNEVRQALARVIQQGASDTESQIKEALRLLAGAKSIRQR